MRLSCSISTVKQPVVEVRLRKNKAAGRLERSLLPMRHPAKNGDWDWGEAETGGIERECDVASVGGILASTAQRKVMRR